MKVILYMATSIDGFVATKDGDSEWVSEVDIPIFDGKIKKAGCIILGRKTFDQFRGQFFPKKDALNIVLTTKEVLNAEENVRFANTPSGALKIAQENGFDEVLLIGGGTTNGSFLKENLIDELFLDIHLLSFGEGIKIFEGVNKTVNLRLLDSEKLENGQMLLHYEVLK